MRCYRICAPSHRSLDGIGALEFGGRWNPPGLAVVYSSTTRSLAALELLVHFNLNREPTDLVLLTIEVPDSVPIRTVLLDDLSGDWYRGNLTGGECQRIGSRWLTDRETAVLDVPSAVMVEERNALLNPEHPDFARIAIVGERPFHFDPRLIR